MGLPRSTFYAAPQEKPSDVELVAEIRAAIRPEVRPEDRVELQPSGGVWPAWPAPMTSAS